jgi:TrmH family RNA methyltransferase
MTSSALSSLSNPRVAAARRLRRRSQRDKAGRFLIEGCRVVETALEARAQIVDLFVSDDASCRERVTSLASSMGIEVSAVRPPVIKALSETTTPQGVVAVVEQPEAGLERIPDAATLVVVLAGISDPGNAGTLVRSAVAAEADAIVFTAGAVDPYAPKTARAAAGLLFSIPVVRGVELDDLVPWLRDRRLQIIGMSAEGDAPIHEVDLSRPTAIVLGNEAWGLSESEVHLLDRSVSIPMPGPVESLNVAVAGSIALFEVVRQRALILTPHD